MAEEAEPAEEPEHEVLLPEHSPGPEAGNTAEPDPEAKAAAAIARRMGWKPKEEWKGDTTNWIDADGYLASIQTQNKSLKEQVGRVQRTAEAIIEKNRLDAIAAAEARIAEASMLGDTEGAIAAARDLATHQKAPTADLAQDFVTRNPWFNTDEEAHGLALGAAERAAKQGKTPEEQFEAAEAAVRKRMPELFGDAAPVTRETRPAPTVQNGTRTAAPAPKRDWLSIPAHIRNEAAKMVAKGMCTQAEYAAEYWSMNAPSR